MIQGLLHISDTLRRQDTGRQETAVLAAPGLRKTQTLLVQEGLPIQEGREIGNEVDEEETPFLVGELAAGHFGVGQLHGRTVPHVLFPEVAIGQVRVAAVRRLVEALAVIDLHPVVAVHEGQIFAGRGFDADIARDARAGIHRRFHESDLLPAAIAFQELAYGCDAVVRPMVVHEDEFDVIQGLVDKGFHTGDDVVPRIVDGHDDGNFAHKRNALVVLHKATDYFLFHHLMKNKKTKSILFSYFSELNHTGTAYASDHTGRRDGQEARRTD